jgi:hypothetical protein
MMDLDSFASAHAACTTRFDKARLAGRSVQGAAMEALEAMLPRYRTAAFVRDLSQGTLRLVGERVVPADERRRAPFYPVGGDSGARR